MWVRDISFLIFRQRPFQGKTEFEINEKTIKGDYKIPEECPKEIAEIITLLLEKDPQKRKKNIENIKKCAWLKNIVWKDYQNLLITSPLSVEQIEPIEDEKEPKDQPLTDLEVKLFKALSEECKIEQSTNIIKKL